MKIAHRLAIASTCAFALSVSAAPASQQSPDAALDLIVKAGRPLRVALNHRIRVERAGQPVTGTLVEPLYAYDRIVIPAGTQVLGHVATLENASKKSRALAMLKGDFSPRPRVVLQFDTVLTGGRELPIETLVRYGVERVRRQVARGAETPEKHGVVARVEGEITQRARDAVSDAKQKVSDVISAVTEPGKMERLKDLAIERLPYHPQYLHKGTVYSAELQSPLTFGTVTPVAPAPPGVKPAPSSILKARLVTALDSSTTSRGTPLEAVVTEPVFSADRQLILPEGTRLTGEITAARAARRFHRNGELRFLFERAEVPGRDATTLLASVYSVDVGQDDHVAVDDEGGTRVADSKTRFIAPALAVLALRGSVDHEHEHHRLDGDADDTDVAGAAESGNYGSRGVGGFFGFGLAGAALRQLSRP
ncbi:MAG: hypothetical protein DMF91_09245, partial [Acidobacteria bacterium]